MQALKCAGDQALRCCEQCPAYSDQIAVRGASIADTGAYRCLEEERKRVPYGREELCLTYWPNPACMSAVLKSN